ncbi:MAG: hypothetical protein EOP04_09705 [Proteobacteria bacterium]|nr:MAG: hypothetical protein EOP04_09705 [Pseudomonadota bacterium]
MKISVAMISVSILSFACAEKKSNSNVVAKTLSVEQSSNSRKATPDKPSANPAGASGVSAIDKPETDASLVSNNLDQDPAAIKAAEFASLEIGKKIEPNSGSRFTGAEYNSKKVIGSATFYSIFVVIEFKSTSRGFLTEVSQDSDGLHLVSYKEGNLGK